MPRTKDGAGVVSAQQVQSSEWVPIPGCKGTQVTKPGRDPGAVEKPVTCKAPGCPRDWGRLQGAEARLGEAGRCT